ncbi:hypothetical protein LINGRAHAP2_LOCUS34750, partial [Linum grandiflorum]
GSINITRTTNRLSGAEFWLAFHGSAREGCRDNFGIPFCTRHSLDLGIVLNDHILPMSADPESDATVISFYIASEMTLYIY